MSTAPDRPAVGLSNKGSGPAFPVLLALTAVAGVPACALWLGGYRWLSAWFRRPLLAYAIVVLAFIPGVVVIDRWQMDRNQFQMGGGYRLWHDVLLGQVVLWVPVLLYEGLRQWMRVREQAAKVAA